MRLVETRYHGPTAHKGARVSVRWSGGRASLWVAWDYALDNLENHRRALARFVESVALPSDSWYYAHTDRGLAALIADIGNAL